MNAKFRIVSLVCFLSFFLFFSLSAQEIPLDEQWGDTLTTNVDLFEESEPLEMTLTLDLKRFQKEKYKEAYMPVHLSIQVNDTLEVQKDVRIKSRGEFRKNHCSFAPFWLNIRKADVKNVHLQEVVKMKIVTHCRGGTSYTGYVMKEYLAYKIYNILSPLSFRVRLIRMRYVDTGRKNKLTESWAFIIEPEEMMAERNNGLVIKNDNLGMVLMRPDEMMLASLFQYMIGNCDYSVAGRHNMKIMGLPGFGSDGYTPVPYDFDYTGFVDADYAIPGENLGITSVRERYYLGPCGEDQAYQKAIDLLENARSEIMAMLNTFPYMGEKEKSRMIAYIEGYYTRSNKPGFIEKDLKRTCR